MKDLKFRPLTRGEIEVRVQSVMNNNKGVVLLLYTKAPICRALLDEAVGPLNWQNSYEEKKGSLHCKISIYDENKEQWVSREDLGEETNVEAAKGEASDAFKRAAAAWGIGRELSTSPRISVFADKGLVDITPQGRCYDQFEVEQIIIEDGQITALAIMNVTKHVRAFLWDNRAKAASNMEEKERLRKENSSAEVESSPASSTEPKQEVQEAEAETTEKKRGRKPKAESSSATETAVNVENNGPVLAVTVEAPSEPATEEEIPVPKSAAEKKAEKMENDKEKKLQEALITVVDIGPHANETLADITKPQDLLWLIQNNSLVSAQAKYVLADMKAKYEAAKNN